MYQITEHTHKFWIKIALITAGVLVAGIILLIATTPSASHKTQITLFLPTPTPIKLKLTTNKGYYYKTKDYSIAVPFNWAPQALNLQNGGNFTTFRPTSAPSGAKEYYPSVVIAVEPIASSSSIINKTALYERFGMTTTTIFFQGTQAVKVSGTFPVKIVNGRSVRQPVQKTLIFFKKGDKIYTLKYYYEGYKLDPQYEQFFNQQLATFTFGQ